MNVYLQQLEVQVNELCDNGVMIFLDSLEDWNVIDMSSYLYQVHQSDWKTRSMFELASFIVVGTI